MAEEKKTEEVKTQAVPAEAPAQKKKSNATLIIVLVLVLMFVVLPAVGFGAFWFLVGRKINKVTDDLSNGKVNIKTSEGTVSLNTSENQSWPSTAPSVVPKFTAGKIANSSRFGDVWTITVTGVTSGDLAAYRTKLSVAGWTLEEEADLGGIISLGAEKSDYQVTGILTTAEKSLILGITKKSSDSSN